jgi:hypothetical protein
LWRAVRQLGTKRINTEESRVKIRKRVLGLALAGSMVAGIGVVASPASAATTPRGSTTLLECDDVVNYSKVKDSTGAGVGFTNRSLKVAGISHPEKWAAGDPSQAKKEPDDGVFGPGTPDWGDTDSCAGVLSSVAGNGWGSAGHFIPYTPSDNFTGSINELVKIAGALYGRTNCAPGATTADEYRFHGKLVMQFGDGAGTPATPAKLNASGKAVGSQAYVAITSAEVDPDPLVDADGDTDPANDYLSDLLKIEGIGIKGLGEGAWFDSRIAFRPPAIYVLQAGEACSFNSDLNGDTVIGQGVGGLVDIVADTDVDNEAGSGAALTNPVLIAAYDNSMIWSI